MSDAPHIPILHLDEDMVGIDKPAGMAVHRGNRSTPAELFVLQTVAEQIGQYLYPVHRLDRNTSGVLTFALQKDMAAALQRSLQSEATVKEYIALTRNEAPEHFISERPLTNDKGDKQPAKTEFTRLGVFDRCSLIRARLYTGRTHQIRRHLQHEALHVLGDSTYGKGRINKWFRQERALPRMFLHAWRLRFAHPRSGEMIELTAPLPEELLAVLRAIGPDAEAAAAQLS